MEEKFLLKYNSFVIFMLNYAPVVIVGIIAALFFHGKIADILEYLIVTGIFIGAFVKGIKPLFTNNRVLMITDKNITLCKFKKKQPVVIAQYDNDSIVKIDGTTVADSGAYIIEKNDGAEILEISSGLKPTKENVLKINAALYKVFGERLQIENSLDVDGYIANGIVPNDLINADKSTRAQQIFWTAINTIFALIPTLLGILAILWLICTGIIFILKVVLHFIGG